MKVLKAKWKNRLNDETAREWPNENTYVWLSWWFRFYVTVYKMLVQNSTVYSSTWNEWVKYCKVKYCKVKYRSDSLVFLVSKRRIPFNLNYSTVVYGKSAMVSWYARGYVVLVCGRARVSVHAIRKCSHPSTVLFCSVGAVGCCSSYLSSYT